MITESSNDSFFRNYGNYGNNAAAMMTMKMPNFGKKTTGQDDKQPIEAKVEGKGKTELNGGLETGGGSKILVEANEEAAMVWDNWEVSDIEIRDVGQQSWLPMMETKDEWDGWYWKQYLDVMTNNAWTISEDREITWEFDLWNFPPLPDFKQLPKP